MTLAPVRQQYEVLPYPHRDPERELEALRQPTLCELPRVQALLWGRPVDRDGLRVLDAGCGTGDNTVFLAEQLRGTAAEIVALDFSDTSLAVNRARLAKRGLADGETPRVRHVSAPIEEAPGLGLGEFDVIVCSGVLHHLASPEEGLRALRSKLKPDGGMALMVYARYGREPVYLMQALMQRLAPASLTPEQRLRILRRTLEGLPEGSRTLRGLMDTPLFRDEIRGSDAGAYDLLLHTQDRSYTVPEVHEWMAGAGMRVLEWSVPRLYEPETYLSGVAIGHLDAAGRQAAAELMNGGMRKHEFYAERLDAPSRPSVAADDRGAVPVWCGWDVPQQMRAAAEQPGGNEFRCTFGPDRNLKAPADALGRYFLASIDGTRTVGEILDGARAIEPAFTARQVARRWVECCDGFRAVAALALYAPAA